MTGRLTWNRLYRATSYLKSALWTVPIFSIALVLLLAPLLRELDEWQRWALTDLGQEGAQALFQTVITLTLSFMVFTFGSLLVAIQVAGGQLTPRIIATLLLRDNVVRYSVGLFTFALMFAVMGLNRLDASVHQGVVLLTAVLGIACIADFLFLIDYAARLLRPVSVVAALGNDGIEVIRSVYPEDGGGLDADSAPLRARLGPPGRVVRHVGRSEIVLAVEVAALTAQARQHDGVIEFLPQVGDFVAADEPLFALYGGAAAVDDAALRAAVAFGPERTLEQDPIFAFRILVDIALKALSAAINDPTTAVLAMDQVHRLLRFVGRRHLRGELVADASGEPRVILRTPNWEDFVHVACTEIRACGASSIQVVRRQRAMLANLLHVLPEYRHAALRRELALLDRAIDGAFRTDEERALARIPDAQGLGGSTRVPPQD
ncbi:MAG: DUF2254 domain-containing protein [Burkholderiales bacterium]